MTLTDARSATFSGALLWDLDGTVLSTAKAGRIALGAAVQEVTGTELDFTDLLTAGLTDTEVAVSALQAAGVEPTAELLARVAAEYERRLPDALLLREGRVLPGVREALEGLAARGRVVSLLATGNTRAGAEAKLARYGIADRFPHGGAFCESDLGRQTIVARALKLAEQLLNGAGPSRIALVGDTPLDMGSASDAGIRSIGVATGSHSLDELREAGAWRAFEQVPPADVLERLVIASS